MLCMGIHFIFKESSKDNQQGSYNTLAKNKQFELGGTDYASY